MYVPRKKMLSISALLTMLIAGLSATPAGALDAEAPGDQAAPAAGETVVLRTVKDPNLVVDMSSGSSEEGASVILYPAHGGANQSWEIVPVQGDWFQLKNKASGTCLVNQFHSVENRHKLTGVPCIKAYTDQHWARVPVNGGEEFTLVDRYSGKCMDQTLNGVSGTEVTQWTCHGLAHQRFTATTV